MNADSRFIHNGHELEATKMSFNQWMDKNPAVKPYDRQLRNKMQQTSRTRHTKVEFQMYSDKWRKTLKRLHTVLFHLCILEKLKLTVVARCSKWGEVLMSKEHKRIWESDRIVQDTWSHRTSSENRINKTNRPLVRIKYNHIWRVFSKIKYIL